MKKIKNYFPELTKKQINQFESLEELYNFWNSKINLISRKNIHKLYEQHVLHSLGITKIINFRENTKILDIGTGGGFPGIPLAIFFPKVNFYLIDSIGKKIKVVKNIIEKLELENCQSEQIRAENFAKKFDFVVSRSVTNFSKFLNFSKKNVHFKHKNSLPNGIFYWKGGDFVDEIKNYKKQISIYNLKDYFEEEFFRTKKIIYWSA